MQNAIFFIAIIPDPEIGDEVRAFQKYVSENFESHRALRAPPHITLIPPFKWRLDDISKLESEMEVFVKTQHVVKIQLNNFSAFPPRVIYVGVEENIKLNNLQGDLKHFLLSKLEIKSDRPERRFHPHMTVAFRDLRKNTFPKAWTHFSELTYQRVFVARQIVLLQHSGARWIERTCFDLLAH